MKKLLTILLLLTLVVNLTGCEALAKKFRRKKKESPKMPRMYQPKKYVKLPTPALYKKHYAYLVSWQSELIQDLGDSHKKDKRCIEEILGNLYDLRNMLLPEKAELLQIHIDKLAKVKETIFNEELSQANKTYILGTLEREDRFIKREFNLTKVKDCLKTSFDDETK